MSMGENNSPDYSEQSLLDAIEEVRNSKDSDDAWDNLEKIADSLERQDEVASLYLEILRTKLSKKAFDKLAKRALRFHEDWFGDAPKALSGIVTQIIETDPNAIWAFERLTVALTAQEEWKELLTVHDRLIDLTEDLNRKKQLLDEAAHIAKDFASDLDRAVDYMLRLLEMNPDDGQLSSSIERILERLGRWVDSIAVWRKRIGSADEEQTKALRLQIVDCCLDHLDDTAQALGELLTVLGENPGDEEACGKLERVLVHENASQEIRLAALNCLRDNYEAENNQEAVVKAIELAMEFMPPEERMSLRREAGTRLASLNRDVEASEHFAKLLLEQPANKEARSELKRLADKSNLHSSYAQALTAAAEACGETSTRIGLLIETAQLYWDHLDDRSKAVEIYFGVLDSEDIDRSVALPVAHNLNELLKETGRDEERLNLLELLSNLERSTAVRNAIAGEAARLADQMGRTDKALAFWKIRLDQDGGDLEALNATANLLNRNERWEELISVLLRRSEIHESKEQRREDLVKVAEIQAEKQNKPEEAIRTWYALIERFGARKDALESVTVLTSTTGGWNELADVLRSAVDDDYQRLAEMATRLGNIQLKKIGDERASLTFFDRALALNPEDNNARAALAALLESPATSKQAGQILTRAYQAAGDWEKEIELLDQRLANAGDREEQVRMLVDAAKTQELLGGDPFAAFETIARAFKLAPLDTGIHATLMRLAETAADWSGAAAAFLDAASACEDNRDRSSELFSIAGSILANKVGDMTAAEEALNRSVELRSNNIKALGLLASIQRKNPGPQLVRTLSRMCDIDPENLDLLFDAAKTAVENLEDYPTKRSALERLLRHASDAMERPRPQTEADEILKKAEFAIDKLVNLDLEAKRPESAAKALAAGTLLPFEPATLSAMRVRAADIFSETAERTRAIDLYAAVLKDKPEDLETIVKLEALLKKENRIYDLIMLLRREEEICEDAQRRLPLRLEIARLLSVVEGRDERVHALCANLEEAPGHPDSIEAICAILNEKPRHPALADVLTNQAEKLEALDDGAQAAHLWSIVADVAEQFLRDPQRAIHAHTRVVELDCTLKSLDALARIYLERDAPAEAVNWLRRRLVDTEDPAERIAVMLKLAKAQIQASQRNKAITTLESAVGEAPDNLEARKLLIAQYRSAEKWEELAEALSQATGYLSDEAAIVAYAREAAEIYNHRLGNPSGAVPVLEAALPFAPEDRSLKSMFIDGLIISGRIDDARKLALELIGDFGRRRSGERAAAHLLLARIARAEGNITEALDQLEQASKMDSQNAEIWQAMAELAREADQLDKAERAFRTLLLIIRRNPSAVAEKGQMGAAEIFLELHQIASDQQRDEQARELLESAFEALSKSDDEAQRIKAKLLKWERSDLLDRFFDTRLVGVENPKTRAEILSEYATILDDPLKRTDDAFDAWIKAIDDDPGSPSIHRAAYKSAKAAEKIGSYVDKLKAMLDGLRRESDAHVRCELLLNLSRAMESDLDDLDSAYDYYQQAEEIGVMEVDVWRIGAKLAARRGDTEEQLRLLKNLASLGEEEGETEARADALYRLAEIQLASQETLQEGLESMNRALAEDPKYVRAGRILGRVCKKSKPSYDLLTLYERIARESDDEGMLLDFLELKAADLDATPEQIREGCELARKLGEKERSKALMLRAVEVGKELLEGMPRIEWALLGLAELCAEAGDIQGSVDWLTDAAESGNPDAIASMATQLAESTAAEENVSHVFLKLYQKLFERDSTMRSVWQPLVEIYTEQQDLDNLERIVGEVASSLSEPEERNGLRLKLGKLFLTVPEREIDAIDALKDILLDEPGHVEALTLLADLFEKSGRTDDLIDLFRHQFETALGTGEPSAIQNTALKLGAYLKGQDPEGAREVFQKGLDYTSENRELLQGLLDCLGQNGDPAERAEIMERMLAFEDEAKAGPLAIQVAAMYESLDNNEGALRTLLTGFSLAPSNESICELLKGIYRERGDHAGLAQILAQAAQSQRDPETKASMLHEAALIYRDQLADFDSAIETFEALVEADPNRAAHRVDLTSSLAAAGRYEEAIEQIGEVISGLEDGEDLVYLLAMRAQILAANGDMDAAVADLERAYEQAPENIAQELETALRHRRKAAAESQDFDVERASTLRLSEILLTQGRNEEALRALVEWSERDPKDAEVLHLILDVYISEGRWDGVAEICAALVQIETGDSQVATVKRLAYAHRQLQTPEAALPWLTLAHETQPDSTAIVGELAGILELIGDESRLAGLLMETARRTEDDSERASLLRRAGQLFLNIGDLGNATEVLQESRKLSPDDPEATVALVDVLATTGKNAEASALLDEAMEISKAQRLPGLGILQRKKARLAREQGDFQEELQWLKQSVLTDRASGETALELADRAEELGEWDIAVWALKTIALMKTGSPMSRGQVFLRQAKISLKRGDQRRATLFARQAEQEEPDSDEIKLFLKELEKS